MGGRGFALVATPRPLSTPAYISRGYPVTTRDAGINFVKAAGETTRLSPPWLLPVAMGQPACELDPSRYGPAQWASWTDRPQCCRRLARRATLSLRTKLRHLKPAASTASGKANAILLACQNVQAMELAEPARAALGGSEQKSLVGEDATPRCSVTVRDLYVWLSVPRTNVPRQNASSAPLIKLTRCDKGQLARFALRQHLDICNKSPPTRPDAVAKDQTQAAARPRRDHGTQRSASDKTATRQPAIGRGSHPVASSMFPFGLPRAPGPRFVVVASWRGRNVGCRSAGGHGRATTRSPRLTMAI
ncbi:hypothetical protein S7711_10603 [Stachybotrys chartarum IBT 7711]|uniref:Uncharacterized protein n=1 Tax=Stachybotrys chartarum (strain CBS 109288 / IBT 7711) TaxID=1280523 RepID=A0A084AYX5_STACB|nr:hypothetical protein S7711_10603 [Stachybotrys chartarum IBT 7711]